MISCDEHFEARDIKRNMPWMCVKIDHNELIRERSTSLTYVPIYTHSDVQMQFSSVYTDYMYHCLE